MSTSFSIIKSQNISNKGHIKLSHYKVEDNSIDISYAKNLAEDIINEANIKKEEIIQKAIENVKEIEKEAYTKGYDQGIKNGYEDGYKEVYEEYIEKAKYEALEIKNNADKILLNSNKFIADYMKSIQKEIIQTCINISSKVLNKHFEDEASMNDMLESIIKKYELDGNIIVKCNEIYIDNLREKVMELENKNKKTKIFLVADNDINKGNVIIEKEEGRLTLGLDIAIERLREELVGV